jgi:hypothetical protein
MTPSAGRPAAHCWAALWTLILLGVPSACSKGSSEDAPAPSATSAAPPASTSLAAPAASTSAAPAAASAGWKGGYKSVAGTITLPKDVKWKVPDSTDGIGEGTIAMTVDRPSGRVRGTLDGVLGPATIDGLASDGKLTATVARQDPTDHGFTGTLSGDLGDAGAHGTMNMALAEVSAVRNATFELAPSP